MHFDWSPDLETGHEDIDAQHQSLFALANELEDALSGDDFDVDTVENAIYGLTDYVVEHFGDEEALMTEARYPALSAHRSLHEHLTRDTMGFAARYFNGERVAASKIAPFVAGWLQEHIRGEDMRFVEFLKRG